MKFSVKAVDWKTYQPDLSAIRTQVFVEEQSVPIEIELDNKDETAFHWLATDEKHTVVGTARMLPDGHIGRMAVLKHCRGKGIGRVLISAAIDHARSLNIYAAYLYAQTHALDFYRKEGFVTHGEEFLEANIPHFTMRKTLFKQRLLGTHYGSFVIRDYRNSVLDLVSQTRQKLLILSFNLDPYVFNSREIVDYVSTLARKSRYTDTRILVSDTSAIVKQRHRLVELQRKISSKISIRKITTEPHLIKHNVIVSDNIGVIFQSIKDPEKAWGNYNNAPVAKNYTAEFNAHWGQASEDRDLSILGI